VYQPAVRGSCDWRTVGIFGEAAMDEQWKGMYKAVMAGTHKAQEGLLVGCDAHTGDETSVGMSQAR
jgi:hypothetical protein